MIERRYWNPQAQTMPRPELLKLQAVRLAEAVERSREAPFFRARLDAAGVRPDDIRTPEDVRVLPRFTKADLRQNEVDAPPIGSYRAKGLSHAVRLAMSTGTTGKPTAAIWTRHDLDIECELSARNHFRLGIRPGMVIVGAHPGYLNGGQSLQQAAYEHMGCLLISIGPPDSTEAAERALRAIQELPVDRWQLFPAALHRLREAADRIGYKGLPEPEAIGPRTQYDKISAGMECLAYLGSTCAVSAGAHLAEDHAIVEALDLDSGEPVSDGERGRMVVTTLDRDNPMLRYDLEDILRIDSTPCPCGETSKRGFWEGREKDVIWVADRMILPIDVWQALPSEAEFVLVRPEKPADRLLVRIEGERDRTIEDRLNESVGVPVDVDWIAAGTLPRASYKAQRVVSA
jgi:phenylacetate-CoA ligase